MRTFSLLNNRKVRPIFKHLNSNKMWNVDLLVKVILVSTENKSQKSKA